MKRARQTVETLCREIPREAPWNAHLQVVSHVRTRHTTPARHTSDNHPTSQVTHGQHLAPRGAFFCARALVFPE